MQQRWIIGIQKANSGIYFVLSFITKEIDNWNVNLKSTRLKDKYFFIFVRILMIHFLTSASLTINVILILLPVHAHATLYLIFMVCLHWVVVLQMILGVIGGHFVWIAYLVIRHSMVAMSSSHILVFRLKNSG